MPATRRGLAETHCWETLRGSLLDPAYGAQAARTAAQVRIGAALDAVLATRPTLATIDALDELLQAVEQRAREVRS